MMNFSKTKNLIAIGLFMSLIASNAAAQGNKDDRSGFFYGNTETDVSTETATSTGDVEENSKIRNASDNDEAARDEYTQADNTMASQAQPGQKTAKDWKQVEADLEKDEADLKNSIYDTAEPYEEALIETSHPYLLPHLFTTPTAYSLNSYDIRFGGQGNIHHTIATQTGKEFKASVAVGLGGVVELGYQLDEYNTSEKYADKIMMGYFKMQILKESQYIPAMAISAGKNMRDNFWFENLEEKQVNYQMERSAYDIVFSKRHKIGGYMFTFHPGVQIIRDELLSYNGLKTVPKDKFAEKRTKVNPRIGLSWQARPKTLFMYELKLQNPTKLNNMVNSGIGNSKAIESNLGARYYLRNWLCMDAGIRYFYNFDEQDDEMKLHANFVGLVPMVSLYTRVENFFKD